MNYKKLEEMFNKIIQVPAVKQFAQTQFALKSAEIAHRLTYEKRDNRMAEAMERFKKCKDKKPKSQIKKEMMICKNFWGCYPLHYYRYNLYRKEKKLSDEQLINYIPEFFFYYLFLPFYDSKKYENLIANKNITEQVFRNLAIPQPHTILKLINNKIYTGELVEKSYYSVNEELIKQKYKKLFIKPSLGQGGSGIYIFHRNDKNEYVNNIGGIFNENFLKKIGNKDNYIIQPGLEQDPEISKIYPYSINTFRVVTENKNGNVRALYAILRMGRGKNEVDNTSQNGIFVNIDVNTGEISSYAVSHRFEYFEKHPNTNFIFKGYKIINWDDVKKLAMENAKKLSEFTYLAWDLALTKDGIITIEANLRFGLDGHQIISGGLRLSYQINDPQFYWKNKGERI
jgi:hypothetical protein